VRRRAEQTVLKILTKSIVDSERDDKRSNSSSDAGDGNPRNDANDGLAPFGPEVSRGDEEFEAHERSSQQSASSIRHWPNWIIARDGADVGNAMNR
jgi:hypothetical protein